MNDPKQASMLNLFSTSGPKGSIGATSFSAVDTALPIDQTFSRELVRANERNVSSHKSRDSSQRDHHESGKLESSKRSEPHRYSDSEKSSRTHMHSAKVPDKTSSSSADKARPGSDGEDVAKSETDSIKNEGTERAEEQAKASSTPASADAASESAPETTTAQVTKPEALSTPAQLAQTDAEAASIEIDSSLPVNAIAGPDQAVGNEKETSSSHLIDAQKVAAGQLPATKEQEGLTVARLSGVAPVDGNQLSPSQLANRQAHLLNSQPARDAKAEESVPLIDESIDGKLNLATTRPVAAVGASLAGVATQMKRLSNTTGQSSTAASVVDLPGKLDISGEEAITDVSQRLQQAELAADAKLVAQQAKQELMQANLAQARQTAQLQVQNANPLSQAVSSVPSDSVNQLPDNMFVVVQGGIVTAPVLQRADSVNAQSINAPINLPILQEDADKAMSGNIRWMVNEGVKNAVVNVTPNGMGPISVTIGMEKDQMSVAIVAMQGSTREALDSMLPRLREQLAAQGHENVKVDISDGRPDQSDRGYGQQFSKEQPGSERGERATGTQVADEDTGMSQIDETSATVESVQGQIMVGNDGKIRRSYDVYV